MTDVLPEPPSIVCPRCGRRSFALRDVQMRYCGACHRFHDEPASEEAPMISKAEAHYRVATGQGDALTTAVEACVPDGICAEMSALQKLLDAARAWRAGREEAPDAE